jgi:pyocin large subunit-like protein
MAQPKNKYTAKVNSFLSRMKRGGGTKKSSKRS